MQTLHYIVACSGTRSIRFRAFLGNGNVYLTLLGVKLTSTLAIRLTLSRLRVSALIRVRPSLSNAKLHISPIHTRLILVC